MDPAGENSYKSIKENEMTIRERDAETIAAQLLKDKKKSKHLLKRLCRYEVEKIDTNDENEVRKFLIQFISKSDAVFSYLKIQRDICIIPELPKYIIEYIEHIKVLLERRKQSGNNKWSLFFFSKFEDIISFPSNTLIYAYFINCKYTMVICIGISGTVSLKVIPTFNRIFDFSSITFLSFADTTMAIRDAVNNKNIITFNKVFEHFLYSFSEQNDFYDDMILQDEYSE